MHPGKARITEVIETSLAMRGTGAKGDGFRHITQYWTLDGRLIGELDPQVTGQGPVVYAEPVQAPKMEAPGPAADPPPAVEAPPAAPPRARRTKPARSRKTAEAAA